MAKAKTANISPETKNGQKSIFWAYFWWLFGGVFGLHHIYLGRDKQAFLWWSTVGGYFGVGWISEIFKIPRYVREANRDPQFIEEFKARVKLNKTVSRVVTLQ